MLMRLLTGAFFLLGISLLGVGILTGLSRDQRPAVVVEQTERDVAIGPSDGEVPVDFRFRNTGSSPARVLGLVVC